MFACAGGTFDGSAGAAVGAAVACGACAGGAVALGSLVAYQACGVFGLTWFRLACGANLWGWLPCVDWVVGVLGTHFSAYNPFLVSALLVARVARTLAPDVWLLEAWLTGRIDLKIVPLF